MAKDDINLDWNFSDYFAGLDAYEENTLQLILKGMKKIGLDGLGKMMEAAPVITGFLRGSASVFINGKLLRRAPRPPDALHAALGGKIGGDQPDRTVIVWGFNAFYAARVHEDMNAGQRAGGPKFVESVLIHETYRWMKFLADFIRAGNDRKGKK
jgi:hypothetical protein